MEDGSISIVPGLSGSAVDIVSLVHTESVRFEKD